ncbi:hypothetical protein BDV95DRAFT_452887, partial [Massariosphaeria phaeospora]
MRSKTEIIMAMYGVDNFDDYFQVEGRDWDSTESPPLEQWIKFPLPYQAAGSPARPTAQEFDTAMIENKLTKNIGTRQVCRIGNMVVKRGVCGSFLQEAENLLYIEKHTQVRAPKLYHAYIEDYTTPDGKTYAVKYLAMEYMEGLNLNAFEFKDMDEKDQLQIAASIGQQLQLLRSIPSEGYYGRVHHQGFQPRTTFLRTRCRDMLGPYE